jgi:hypothetical protein
MGYTRKTGLRADWLNSPGRNWSIEILNENGCIVAKDEHNTGKC